MSKPVVEKTEKVKLEDFGLPADFDIDKEMERIKAENDRYDLKNSQPVVNEPVFDEATRIVSEKPALDYQTLKREVYEMMQNRGFSMSETETDEFIRNEKKIKETEETRPKPEDFGISPRSYDEINKMIENHEPKNKLPTPQLPEHRSKKNIVDDFESEEENELEESVSFQLKNCPF